MDLEKITDNQEFVNLAEWCFKYSATSDDLAKLKTYNPKEADEEKAIIYYMLGELSSYGSSDSDSPKRKIYDDVFIPKLKGYKLLLEKKDSDTTAAIESVLTKLKKDEKKSNRKDFLTWLMVMIGIIIAFFILLSL